MCLGGSAAPTWQPPQRQDPEPGPDSPNDKVNNTDVPNANPRGLPDRPNKEYAGWQRDEKYSGGWMNPDGTVGGGSKSGGSQSSKY